MSISIVATAGGASANSFVTVAEADAYLEARRNASDWNDENDDDEKMSALIEATRELSAIRWQGNRVTSTQALSWPRDSATNPDGTCSGEYYDTDVIPQRIKDATYELALEFLKAGTSDLAAAGDTDGITLKTVGPLTTEYAAPSQRAQGLARFPRVMKLIGPLLETSSGQVRLTR